MVSQPQKLRIKLFDHQLASIYKMEKLEQEQMVERDIPPGENKTATIYTETKLGINSDPTGYGKTLSMIGLIVRDKMEWDLDLPFISEKITTESAGLVRTRVVNRYTKLTATLILVSSSILLQWKQELNFSDLIVVTISAKKDIDKIDVTKCNVVIVTTSMYNYLISSYSKFAWKRIIFDEPGHYRVPGMKHVTAGFYWFVTATPNQITAKHRNCRGSFMKKIIGDNWCEFEEQFGDLIIRNDNKFVQESFNMPESKHFYYDCFQPLSNTVNGLIHPVITNMIDAGNIEGAINSLGGTKTKNIIELVRNKKLEELEQTEYKIKLYTTREDRDQLRHWTKKKIRVKIQLNELDMRFSAMLQGICYICRDVLKCPVLEPSCQNLFCGKCLLTWLKKNKTCPTCRSVINLKNLIYVKTCDDENTCKKNKIILPQTKVEKVIQLIKDNKKGKFLIFSSFDASFEPICRLLKECKIKYALIKGSCHTRQKNINKFKQGLIQVIFLNSQFNGAGINLQETTDLILYHKMSKNTYQQIIGRAERIGRVSSLRIHHLLIKNN